MLKRNEALELLRSSSDPVSGENIATELGVSRAAVWKQIEHLRQVGYVVSGSPRVGYRLLEAPEEPLAEEVAAHLEDGFPGDVHYFSTLDSTNDKAKELAAAGAPSGTVVIAGRQSSGRGRRGRAWQSPPGGLWMSVVLRPDIPLSKIGRLAIATPVVVAEAIEKETSVKPLIKWPNDLLVSDKKLAGILIEIVAEMESLGQAVVGVGVNANVDEKEFAADIRHGAASILSLSGKKAARAPLAAAIASGLLKMSASLDDRSLPRWLDAWRARSAVLDRSVTITNDGQVMEGVAVDIDLDGALLVRRAAGDVVAVRLGEASLRIEQ